MAGTPTIRGGIGGIRLNRTGQPFGPLKSEQVLQAYGYSGELPNLVVSELRRDLERLEFDGGVKLNDYERQTAERLIIALARLESKYQKENEGAVLQTLGSPPYSTPEAFITKLMERVGALKQSLDMPQFKQQSIEGLPELKVGLHKNMGAPAGYRMFHLPPKSAVYAIIENRFFGGWPLSQPQQLKVADQLPVIILPQEVIEIVSHHTMRDVGVASVPDRSGNGDLEAYVREQLPFVARELQRFSDRERKAGRTGYTDQEITDALLRLDSKNRELGIYGDKPLSLTILEKIKSPSAPTQEEMFPSPVQSGLPTLSGAVESQVTK